MADTLIMVGHYSGWSSHFQLHTEHVQSHKQVQVPQSLELEAKQEEQLIPQSTNIAWSEESWRSKPTLHQVQYPDPVALLDVCALLRSLPPLVTLAEIEQARSDLAEVALGRAFIIQGGDCAESFDDVQLGIITKKRALLAEQAAILGGSQGFNVPVVQIGRIAGQYAKPRSSQFEVHNNGSLINSFLGHNVNEPHLDRRTPNPTRLLLGYLYAATTLHTLNCTTQSVHPKLIGPFYTSHEALHLPLESSLTHGEYNTSAAFLWIGERTRHLDGGHLEYIRGLRNPIGIKISGKGDPVDLVRLLNLLDPEKRDIGRITLITRLGNDNVETTLPQLVMAVKASGHTPIWMCDPCHGCTETIIGGVKTRRVERLLDELMRSFVVHQQCGTYLGGIHLEQTGEAVTECISGGPYAGEHKQVMQNFRSLCDPRLSATQAVQLVQGFVDFVRKHQQDIKI